MDKSLKFYNKALEQYNNGFIDKGIELCERSISININNAAAINLKGLLYYIKGDLDGCRKLWKMNCHLNKDQVSEKYLKDTKEDKRLLKLYSMAIPLIKELKINEALTLLNECEKSHFNYINVNNYLAICYVKKGDYKKSQEHINKVLKVDNKNKVALENKKNLKKYGISKKEMNFNPYMTIGVVLIFLIINISLLIKYNKININALTSKYKATINKKDATLNSNNTNKKNSEENKKVIKEQEQKIEEEKFPYNEIKKSLDQKDFNKLYDYLIKWNSKELNINDKSLLGKGKELLDLEGGEYFYNKGYELLEKENHNAAKTYLERAYNYGKGTWYYPHAIYLLSTIYEKIGDIDKAIKYYTIYDSNFENGDYEEIVLYNLCLLYKNIDINKGKTYGKKLSSKFPQSIYNNSKIQEILYK
ncbi:tetratricopeptide (TPR) repeat protein [Clostridium tetanomorphum]|uniref:Tetratricopeptide repeat protein n=1 Tax=Clostridium tetanomorphum TaxID=1553 RepID=A0A923J010_CLOTT|nr:hypothetical protein [Clostridium tetanomorphum]KAJ52277.1 hypothetical protein CTM_08901 [Clostridium tetanomorphum DSM 665]MBC2397572.1 hypothetical protein [Clostridium tetanomorphum]MBP1863718.1 tetratricopeptide (TPR) repeat protein [Clostridium tetanomorphum]NRS86294.1 tetratricopeptide (TPR) repeat protein [Clostridium tetanomorphum]NRZ95676.1 tetratricopeptide (TPR) repeat protein [Clostridium tetanomorphum]